MKIFAIRDEYSDTKDLAYLIYYESEKQFYIELPDGSDEWEVPMLLSQFVKKGETTVNSYWSKVWVQQRIVPTDRQNLGQILKDNGLKQYDEFELLMLGKGRCAQDDYYLEPLDEDNLPEELVNRFNQKIDDVVPLSDYNLLVFFCSGEVKKCNVKKLIDKNRNLKKYLSLDEQRFNTFKLNAGGYGVSWNTDMCISYSELYKCGKSIPLSLDDFISFVSYNIVSSSEASELLDCSRQNINDLVNRNKLQPVKTTAKTTLFLKSDVLKRMW